MAAAVIEGMRRALAARTVNPEVVLVEARQAADADGAHAVPIGVQALAHYDRPTPTLGGYDALLDSDQVRSNQAAARHGQHRAAGHAATADHCAFCGGTEGPFTRVEGLFTVLMCPTCLAARARGRGPYPDITDEELRAGLNLMSTWALAQKVAANREVIAVMRRRLERGERVVPMYRPLGLAWLRRRQAEIAEQIIHARGQPRPTP